MADGQCLSQVSHGHQARLTELGLLQKPTRGHGLLTATHPWSHLPHISTAGSHTWSHRPSPQACCPCPRTSSQRSSSRPPARASPPRARQQRGRRGRRGRGWRRWCRGGTRRTAAPRLYRGCSPYSWTTYCWRTSRSRCALGLRAVAVAASWPGELPSRPGCPGPHLKQWNH